MPVMTRDPVEGTKMPVQQRGRYIHSVQFTYTSTATGALELTTPAVAPDDHPWIAYWFEVDTENINPSANFDLHLEFPAGHEYENHSYLIDEWTGAGAENHVVTQNTAVPVPAGAIFRLAISAVQVDTVVKIHGLIEWI